MIVVDNGSTDATAAVARALGARVVTEPRRGYGAAVHAGLEAAQADLVAVLDGDGSIDPGVLPGWPRRSPRARPTWRSAGGCRSAGAWPWHARAGNAVIAAALRRARRRGPRPRPVRVASRAALLELGVADRTLRLPARAAAAGRGGRAGGSARSPVPYRPGAGGRSKVSGSLRGTVRAARDMAGLLR